MVLAIKRSSLAFDESVIYNTFAFKTINASMLSKRLCHFLKLLFQFPVLAKNDGEYFIFLCTFHVRNDLVSYSIWSLLKQCLYNCLEDSQFHENRQGLFAHHLIE